MMTIAIPLLHWTLYIELTREEINIGGLKNEKLGYSFLGSLAAISTKVHGSVFAFTGQASLSRLICEEIMGYVRRAIQQVILSFRSYEPISPRLLMISSARGIY
jgi:hypothetical protein